MQLKFEKQLIETFGDFFGGTHFDDMTLRFLLCSLHWLLYGSLSRRIFLF